MLSLCNDIFEIIINLTKEYAVVVPFICKKFYKYLEVCTISHEKAIMVFCSNGHIELVKWARIYLKWIRDDTSFAWNDIEYIRASIRGGHIQTMIWLLSAVQLRYPLSFCGVAAAAGQLEILKYLLDKGQKFGHHQREYIYDIAKNGHLRMLQWLEEEKVYKTK